MTILNLLTTVGILGQILLFRLLLLIPDEWWQNAKLPFSRMVLLEQITGSYWLLRMGPNIPEEAANGYRFTGILILIPLVYNLIDLAVKLVAGGFNR